MEGRRLCKEGAAEVNAAMEDRQCMETDAGPLEPMQQNVEMPGSHVITGLRDEANGLRQPLMPGLSSVAHSQPNGSTANPTVAIGCDQCTEQGHPEPPSIVVAQKSHPQPQGKPLHQTSFAAPALRELSASQPQTVNEAPASRQKALTHAQRQLPCSSAEEKSVTKRSPAPQALQVERFQGHTERQVSSPPKPARPLVQASRPAEAQRAADSPCAAEWDELLALSRKYDLCAEEDFLSSTPLRTCYNEVKEAQTSPSSKVLSGQALPHDHPREVAPFWQKGDV
jgi:hypothetical protein